MGPRLPRILVDPHVYPFACLPVCCRKCARPIASFVTGSVSAAWLLEPATPAVWAAFPNPPPWLRPGYVPLLARIPYSVTFQIPELVFDRSLPEAMSSSRLPDPAPYQRSRLRLLRFLPPSGTFGSQICLKDSCFNSPS